MARYVGAKKEVLLKQIRDLLNKGIQEGIFGGSNFIFGTGAPSPTLGVDGDVYLDTDTGEMYQKLSGVWTVQFVAGDAHYVHTQGAASTLWIINHGLGKHPSVRVLDSAGTEVEGEVNDTDENTLTIEFSAPFSGVAYMN